MPKKKRKQKGSTIRKPRSGRPGIIGFFDDNSPSKLTRESTEAEYNPLQPTIELRRPKYRDSFATDDSSESDLARRTRDSRRKSETDEEIVPEKPESRKGSQSESRIDLTGKGFFDDDSSDEEDKDNEPRIKPEKDEDTGKWSREEAAKHMMGGVGKTLAAQNTANAVVWYNTMFSGNETLPKSERNPDQERVLKEQQDFLKRHFLAMAVLGLDAGDQDKNTYRPLEEITDQEGTRVNLATVSSGGGRLNYRSTAGTGDDFKGFLFFGSAKPKLLPEGKTGKKPHEKGEYSEMPAGTYYRVSTHNESFNEKDNKILEGKKASTPAIGLSIPIGGVGQRLKDFNKKEVITGYQGISTTKGGKKYQTGAGLVRHATKGDLGNTMVAFEGSAPYEGNIFGGSHGRVATVKKYVGFAKSEFTLTGQGKRPTWGLTQKLPEKGSIKADVDDESLGKLKDVWEKVKSLDAKAQQEFYQKLLETTTQVERDVLVESLRSGT